VFRCLSADPADRPGTAEVAQALLDARNSTEPVAEPVHAPPVLAATRPMPFVPPPPVQRSRRQAVLLAAVAVLLLATALMVGVQLADRSGRTPAGAVQPSLPSVQPGPTGTPGAASSAPPSKAPSTHSASGAPHGNTSPRPAVSPLTVVDHLISEVQTSADAGEIRADVALDLENVLHQIRNRILSGEHLDYPATASQLRSKIAQRMDEAAITDSCGTRLLALTDQLGASVA
jgi:serine/threonine-protein kinase